MPRNRIIGAALVLSLAASSVLACAFDWPNQLLGEREATLKAPMANGFEFEARRLVPPPSDTLRPAENWLPYPYLRAAMREDEEYEERAEGLTPEQTATLESLADRPDGDAVISAEVDLPPALRLYAAGAADFRKGLMDKASERFRMVVALPEQDRALRATFAAYMLGVIAVAAGDADKVASAFALTRDFALAGAPDPEGLAVASYGEEARFHLKRAMALVRNEEIPAESAGRFATEIGAATRLYGEQVARGSVGGVWSLRIVAETLLKTRGGVSAAVEDASARHLLVSFVLARFCALDDFRETLRSTGDLSSYDAGESSEDNSQIKSYSAEANDVIDALATSTERHPPEWLTDADRLAVLAYRQGRYDIAKKYADKAAGPLAVWVKAKLALQKGDVAAAAAYYAKAIEALSATGDDPSVDNKNRALLKGEEGVLTLARGEYVAALRQLDATGDVYFFDAAYIAERVLTIDELKTYVDGKASGGLSARDRISDVLARRLVREGRPAEAIPYYKDDEVRQQAAEYVRLLDQAKRRWTKVGKAEALFGAAVLARHAGLRIMGSEGAPDNAYLEGDFEALWGDAAPSGTFVTPGEQGRFSASAIRPFKRWHYRFVAADEAERAADLLAPKSQAFAAVLACATSWVIARDPERGEALYRRYVKEGAMMPIVFGPGRCTDPDFDKARTTQLRSWYRDMEHFVVWHKKYIAIGGLIAAVCCLMVWHGLRSGNVRWGRIGRSR